MKTFDKTLDRILTSQSHKGRLIWNSETKGTYNVLNNASKRKDRAVQKEQRRLAVLAHQKAGLPGRCPKR